MSYGQLDFILEMHAQDNPKTFKFSRGSEVTPDQVNLGWANVLIGKALAEFEGAIIPKLPGHIRQQRRMARRALEISRADNQRNGEITSL